MTRSFPDRRTAALVTTLAAALGAGGCSTSETRLEARAFLGEEPIAGLEITALPFDSDRLFDSLAGAASTPKPAFPDLEAEWASYSRPDERELRELGTSWGATRDSVGRLADSLTKVTPSSPGYAVAYGRLRQQYRRLAQRAAERDAALLERIGDDRQLALRATAAADTLRAWERDAYADFPALADSAMKRAGASWNRGVTNDAGVTHLVLAPGSWWLIARRPDPENPFAEYYWNVAVVVSGVGPSVVPLHSGNGTTRWRH